MSNYQPVTKDRYADMLWRRPASHQFAAQDTVAPVSAAEVPRAVFKVPVGFIKQEGAFSLVMIQGLLEGENWFVSPSGKWRSTFFPNVYRFYPFKLAKIQNNDKDKLLLAVDIDSGLLAEASEVDLLDPQNKGYSRIFENTGELSESMQQARDFLTKHYAEMEQTRKICGLLLEENLFEPWPVEFPHGDSNVEVTGLYRISQQALSDASASQLARLRDSGALMLCYGHLFSSEHLKSLIDLVVKQKEWAGLSTKDQFSLSDNDSSQINFDSI